MTKHVATLDRQRKVLESIIGGATLEEAADAAGYAGRQGAQKARDAALAAVDAKVHSLAEQFRSQSEQRLARGLKAIWKYVKKGDLSAIDRWLRIEARWSKLRGGDAPTKNELTGKDGAPLAGAHDALLAKLDSLADRFAPEGSPSEARREPDDGGGH